MRVGENLPDLTMNNDEMGISHLAPGWQLLAIGLLVSVLLAVWWVASWFAHAIPGYLAIAIGFCMVGIGIGNAIARWDVRRQAARSAKEPE